MTESPGPKEKDQVGILRGSSDQSPNPNSSVVSPSLPVTGSSSSRFLSWFSSSVTPVTRLFVVGETIGEYDRGGTSPGGKKESMSIPGPPGNRRVSRG